MQILGKTADDIPAAVRDFTQVRLPDVHALADFDLDFSALAGRAALNLTYLGMVFHVLLWRLMGKVNRNIAPDIKWDHQQHYRQEDRMKTRVAEMQDRKTYYQCLIIHLKLRGDIMEVSLLLLCQKEYSLQKGKCCQLIKAWA